jgi:hypothetical protein
VEIQVKVSFTRNSVFTNIYEKESIIHVQLDPFHVKCGVGEEKPPCSHTAEERIYY